MATDYKSLDLEMLEQEYYTHVIEFDNIQERLNNKIDLDNKKYFTAVKTSVKQLRLRT